MKIKIIIATALIISVIAIIKLKILNPYVQKKINSQTLPLKKEIILQKDSISQLTKINFDKEIYIDSIKSAFNTNLAFKQQTINRLQRLSKSLNDQNKLLINGCPPDTLIIKYNAFGKERSRELVKGINPIN